MITDKQHHGSRPGCVDMEEAAVIFGWPNYYLPFLVRAGHLKPLGKPAQNARKWFATVEIERMSATQAGSTRRFASWKSRFRR
jgi:hypothetical protein